MTNHETPGADGNPAEDSPTGSQPPKDPDDDHADRALLVLVGILVFAVASWFLVQKLWEVSKIQDCVMSGRKNCAPIDTDSTRK